MKKVYVEVVARFTLDGNMFPQAIIWPDGRTYQIDKVLDMRRAASVAAGGQGIRYTVRVRGEEKYLFYDKPLWFVEGRE